MPTFPQQLSSGWSPRSATPSSDPTTSGHLLPRRGRRARAYLFVRPCWRRRGGERKTRKVELRLVSCHRDIGIARATPVHLDEELRLYGGEMRDDGASSGSPAFDRHHRPTTIESLRPRVEHATSCGMSDSLLADTDIQEALSGAYVTTVASFAGYVVAQRNFDRDGVDLTIEAGDAFRPKIDLQLKASFNLDDSAEEMAFFCPKRNYDLLRIATQVPRLLLVLRMPAEKPKWVNVSPTELVLKHCAYWMSLRGHIESENKTGQTVYIPTSNRFNVLSLQALMEQSRTGKIS